MPTHHAVLSSTLEDLVVGLYPFLERELGGANRTLPAQTAQATLTSAVDNWTVLARVLGDTEGELLRELAPLPERLSAGEEPAHDATLRYLDAAQHLLHAVSASEQEAKVERAKAALQKAFKDAQRRSNQRLLVLADQARSDLARWRDVVRPHPDVASGRFQEAEFAADLDKVRRGQAGDEYAEPIAFFKRTYITEGIRDLLLCALRRLTGTSGDPVIELQTNFGGGKTHSMLSLYHLFSGVDPKTLPGVGPLLSDADVTEVPKASRAVLVGTALSPGEVTQKPDGTYVRTLWGEMAWQLGGKEGYALVAKSDKAGVSPGSSTLDTLFQKYGPCLVLIDEWVAYARQLVDKRGLPAGDFEAQASFAQALTESASRTPGVLVVASIPASRIEIGGSNGKFALDTLRDVFQRVGTSWRPASAEEGFEIVRRRLFQDLDRKGEQTKRTVAAAFAKMYTRQAGFPPECREQIYQDKLERAYPFHPALFEALYGAWSTLDKFQRTRGVLRLLSNVVHVLWQAEDHGLLILPASIPIDEPTVKQELVRYLEDQWEPVLSTDIDGPGALSTRLDQEFPTLTPLSASRRVARTIYMGSAPGHRRNTPGIDKRAVRLGCAQPGETVPAFDDALRKLSDKGMYLYQDGTRYWFSTHPSVNRTAADRASRYERADVLATLEDLLSGEQKRRGQFPRVYVCPEDTGAVPDELDAQLVVLPPSSAHRRRNQDSRAMKRARDFLEQRGNVPRKHRNTLVFLAADVKELDRLLDAVRQLMAWESICNEEEVLNLTPFQRKQAQSRLKQAQDTATVRIAETWIHALTPFQETPQDAIEWEEVRIPRGSDSLAERASKKLVGDGKLLTKLGGLNLRMAMDTALWADRNHVSLGTLRGYYADYLYLDRLRNFDVLVGAAVDGAGQMFVDQYFALARSFDDATERYEDLVYGGGKLPFPLDEHVLVVRAAIARAQSESETPKPPGPPDGPIGDPPPPDGPTGDPPLDGPTGDPPPPPPPTKAKKTSFFGDVQLDAARVGVSAQQIENEVLVHLRKAGGQVTVTLNIEVTGATAFDEATVRTVIENCNTLGFESHDFEEDG